MTTKELQKYLGVIFDLEKERYMQNCLYNELQNRIANLGIARSYDKPDELTVSRSGPGFAILCTLVGGFLGYWIGTIFVCSKNFIDCTSAHDADNEEMIGGWITAVIVGIICAAISGYLTHVANRQYDEKYYEYEERCKEYQKLCNDDEERVEAEKKEVVYLREEVYALKEQIDRTSGTLQELYSIGVLFEKYWWDIVAIASFNEYLNSGRCTELIGHEGAYNIYEMEIRLNHIVGQLDEVIRRLDQIQRNQYMIYTAIQEANQKLNGIYSECVNISSGMDKIEGQNRTLIEKAKSLQANSELSLYFAEQNNRELQYRNQFLK